MLGESDDNARQINSGRPPPRRYISGVDKWVGTRIKIARLETGMSQETFGTKNGVDRNKVYKWEAGRERLTVERLFRIAQICHKNVGWYFQGFESETAKGAALDRPNGDLGHLLAPKNVHLLSRLDALEPADRAILNDILDAFEIRAEARKAMEE